MGASRADVIAGLGKPMSALQRGDTEVLMYANSVRIEIRDDEVVSYRSGNQAVLVKSDGTRYAASDRGKVTRLDSEEDDASGADGDVVPARTSRPASATAAAAVNAPEATNADEEDEADDPAEVALAPDEALAEGPEMSVEEQYQGLTDAITQLEGEQKKAMGPYGEPGEDVEEATPPWANAVGTIVLALFRFGFAVLVLRLAIGFVDLPCYMPDVLKVAALFVVIREGIYGLGNLGGHWQWLHLFRAADVISFIALCCLLVQFKVTTQGIIALKIAVATEVATYIVMMGIGLALMFALGTML